MALHGLRLKVGGAAFQRLGFSSPNPVGNPHSAMHWSIVKSREVMTKQLGKADDFNGPTTTMRIITFFLHVIGSVPQ